MRVTLDWLAPDAYNFLFYVFQREFVSISHSTGFEKHDIKIMFLYDRTTSGAPTSVIVIFKSFFFFGFLKSYKIFDRKRFPVGFAYILYLKIAYVRTI